VSNQSRLRGIELLEVISVGMPFCGFKILSGLSLLGRSQAAAILGWVLLALGGVDGFINAVNFASLLTVGRRTMEDCFFALATRAARGTSDKTGAWRDLGNSLDILLSFSLVAVIIAGGRIRSMPSGQLLAWNVCVVLNVVGAGLGRLQESLRKLKQGDPINKVSV
jgi:hypothetical protein